MRDSRLVLTIAGLLIVAACDNPDPSTVSPELEAPTADAKMNRPGFRTTRPAQAALVAGIPGEMIPLATAGDFMPGSGEQLDGIPDGIGSFGNGRYMSSYMNHEISGGAKVSYFEIDSNTGKIIDHYYPIDGSEGYSRLCSASWQDADDGFPGGAFFTGEEFDAGVQLAIDRQGRVTELPHIGYYAHEQQISVPGFTNDIVVVNYDDDGTSGGDLTADRSESEFYMYAAKNSNGVLRGTGTLYVFKTDEASDVGDMAVGDEVTGYWVPVPEQIALDNSRDPATGKPPLQGFAWDNGAFGFTRLEDGFYDKVSTAEGGLPAVYIFDTGDATLGNPADGFWDKWGSIYRMEWQDPTDPAGETTLTLLARSNGPSSGWASPDNGDMDANGVIALQEDPAAGPWTRDEVKVFAFQRAADGSLVDPAGTPIITTVGSSCAGGGGINGRCWETSGIEDVSRWYGENAWIFNVQSKARIPAICPDCASDGQVLLVKIGGEFGFDN
jgi:hypothetical protein